MPASEDTKEKVAAVGFAAVLAAAMGPVGILIAALSIGIDRAISGEGGRETSADLTREQVEDQRQWLAEDRAWREKVRAARREWWDAGADPDKEPARPSRSERTGRWWRRLWARMAVAWDDFRRGFRDGWHAAKDAHGQGADWWETARTKPDHPDADEFDWDWADEPTKPTDTDKHPEPSPSPDAQPEPAQPNQPDQPNQEDPMTPPATTNAPTGPSNVDVLAEKQKGIGRTIDAVDNLVDQLSRLADKMASQVREASDFANSTGQATATKAALDATNNVVAKLRQLVGGVSDAAATASDEVAASRASLRPVQQAQDDIRATGATGDAVATAKAA